jgi:hypothetical protein
MIVRSPMNIRTVSILVLLVAPAAVYAQCAFISPWQAHVSQTQSKQPGWSLLRITQYPSLIQVVRIDIVTQITAAYKTTCRPMEVVA